MWPIKTSILLGALWGENQTTARKPEDLPIWSWIGSQGRQKELAQERLPIGDRTSDTRAFPEQKNALGFPALVNIRQPPKTPRSGNRPFTNSGKTIHLLRARPSAYLSATGDGRWWSQLSSRLYQQIGSRERTCRRWTQSRNLWGTARGRNDCGTLDGAERSTERFLHEKMYSKRSSRVNGHEDGHIIVEKSVVFGVRLMLHPKNLEKCVKTFDLVFYF